jgi:hypothetical protein
MSHKYFNDNSNDKSILWRWDDMIRFQLIVAERWLERGNKAGDVFSKFFLYFSGFNAIYFLWRKIDNLDNTSEGKHIENLLYKLDKGKALQILDKIMPAIQFFINRRPIQRMDKRDMKNQYFGEESEGKKWKRKLQDNQASAIEKINAIGQIVYLVRSNLVHGSKAESGDDFEVISNAVEPLRLVLEETLSWSRQQCPWEK